MSAAKRLEISAHISSIDIKSTAACSFACFADCTILLGVVSGREHRQIAQQAYVRAVFKNFASIEMYRASSARPCTVSSSFASKYCVTFSNCTWRTCFERWNVSSPLGACRGGTFFSSMACEPVIACPGVARSLINQRKCSPVWHLGGNSIKRASRNRGKITLSSIALSSWI